MSDNILSLKKISKSFGGVKALKSVDADFLEGTVTAVCGENGAGKSTMMKIIIGAYPADEGHIYLRDELKSFKNPLESLKAGISIVHQEPTVFGDMSVLENLFIASEPLTSSGAIDWNQMAENAREALEIVGLEPNIINKNMNELALGAQQLVLIAKAVYNRCNILILDEPTSILSQSETDRLFAIIRKLKKQKVSVIYISHRMQEIYKISDKIIVLKDGEVTGTFNTSETTDEMLIKGMSGRTFSSQVYVNRNNSKDLVLETRHLTNNSYFTDVNIKLHRGEILGMYGLVGAGRSEFARAIFGDLNVQHGKIILEGREKKYKHPNDAIKDGVFYLPEDRGEQGLFKLNSIKLNMTSPFLNSLTNKIGLIKRNEETRRVNDFTNRYNIKSKNNNQNIMALSGGNQQKVLFSRWLFQKPKVLILDEPSRGVDVGTKAEMHKYIMDLAVEGISILLITSDITELLMLADRIITMRQGSITGELTRAEATEEEILKLSIGF